MVAIVTGAGLGLGQSSLNNLGASGQIGSSGTGPDDESVFVNASNGNLVISRTDEILSGLGLNDNIDPTYNSLSASTGYGASNGWQTNDARAVWGLSGTLDTSGSTVYRTSGDGTVSTYVWNATDGAYVSTQAGQGANRLTYNSGTSTWTWTDGTDQTSETYDATNGGRIVSATDANGNTLTYSYTGSQLTQVTDADGEYAALSYDTNGNLAQVSTYYYANAAAKASNTLTQETSVFYTYDSQNRLSTVTTSLTPTDNSSTVGGEIVTTYGYDGTSNRITSIGQTGGAQVTIGYTLVGSNYQVSSVAQTTSTGVTNTTSFSYGTGSTTVTDNAGNVTTLAYDASGNLTQMTLPPAQSGATAEVYAYTYNSDGDLLTATDPQGNVTTYTYDANDNLLTKTDALGNTTTYTYDANNHVLTETTAGPGGSLLAGTANQIVASIGDSVTFDPTKEVQDASGATLTLSSISSPSHGTASIVSGQIVYTRTSAGTDNFTYTVTDTDGRSATGSVVVADTWSAIGSPVANNMSTQVAGVGNSLTFDPRSYDTDANGFPLTITALSSPSHGTATITAGGTSIQYTRTGSGPDSFTYTLSDGHGNTSTATILVADTTTVASGPSASNIAVTVAGGTSLSFDPRADTSDVNGYPLTVTAVSTPSHGTATITGGGTGVTYSRTGSGADSFTYTVSDGHGYTATATVSVADANETAPTAANVTIKVAGTGSSYATTFNPIADCTSPYGYPLTITAVSTPTYGTATYTGSSVTYTRSSNHADSFTYTISDGHGHTATATISVSSGTGTNTDSVYVGTDSAISPGVGSSVTISPLTNDASFLNSAMTITAVTTPTHGTVSIVNGGTQIQYTQTSAGTDSFTYQISDVAGTIRSGTVNIVAPPTQTMNAENNLVNVSGVGVPVTFSPLANDYNFLGYGMTITSVSSPSHGAAYIVGGGTQIEYVASAYAADSFTYTISDGHGNTATATVNTTVTPNTSQILTPVADTVSVNGVGDSATFNPLTNDTNFLAYGMTITAVSTPSHGTASITGGGTGITYTRTSAGADSFTYTVSDGHGNTATATVNVVSNAVGGIDGPSSESATKRYVYDANENLRFVVDADGEVTQFLYNAAGEVTSEITYPNDLYNLTGLSSSTPIALSTMISWASGLSDLSTVQRVDTTYDWRGNVASVTRYSACDSSGNGLTSSPYTVETYVYDPSGNLLSKQTSGVSNSQVYTYDGMGRVLTATNLNGGVTTYTYNDSSDTETVVTPDGLTTVNTYNLAGQLISSAQSGTGLTSGTASYAYDSRGNLGAVTDADGNTSYFLYDALGRKVADIAADGSIVEYRFNQDNQLVATIAYATKLTSLQLSSLMASGVPTDPALSTVRPASAATDVWSWKVYDADGRTIEAIDGDGSVTTYAYDAFSNLTSTTTYANKLFASIVAGFETTLPTGVYTPVANAAADATTRNFYDNEGRLIGSLDADGYLTRTIYNDAGQVVQTVAYATQASSSLWASGTLSALIASVGTSSADQNTYNFYDDRGLLTVSLDAAFHPTGYVYDTAGHLIQKIAYAGSVASSSSYTLATVETAISTAGLTTSTANESTFYIYDTTSGLLDYTIDAGGEVVQYRYDAAGNVTKVTQFATLDAVSAAPSQATMDSWASANGTSSDRITRTLYNPAGQVAYTVDAKGYVTQFNYDAAGRVTLKVEYASPYTVTDSTTTSGLATLIGGTIPSSAIQLAYAYDVDGRLSDSYDGQGYDTHLTYDAQGRLTDSTAAYGSSEAATTHYIYDGAGRVASVTQGYGTSEAATTSYTYTGLGQVLTATDPDGNVTAYQYDGTGQLVAKTAGFGTAIAATTSYVYDAFGRVTSLTDPDTHVSHFTYDADNDELTAQDGTSATTTNTYDAFGNVLTSTDALGNVTYYFYDHLNRQTLMVDAMKYATATTYGFGNEIASVTHYATAVSGTIVAGTPPSIATNAADATTSFTRDVRGQVTLETDALGNTQSYTYDAFGNIASYTNQLGGTTTYAYDKRNLMTSETLPETSITSSGTTEATSVTNTYSYDGRGNRTQMVEASGLTEQRTTNYAYDHLNRLISQSGDSVTVTSTSDLKTTSAVTPTTTYVYDKAGNLIETTDPNGNQTFTYYDALNRKIAQVNAVGTLSTWAYDADGNATSAIVYGDAVALPTTPGGAPPQPLLPNVLNYRQTTYTYDADGRQLTSTIANVLMGMWTGSTYTTSTANITTTNVYDADGNLIEQTDGRGNSTFTYYDKLGHKIASVDPDNYITGWTLDQNGNVLSETRYATKLSGTPTTSSNPATLISSVGTSSNDRTTTFTYDKNGNRLTETRTGVQSYTVNGTTGALTLGSTSSTIAYTYNGLGEVTSQTQATGDATSYTYDSMGRQTLVQLSAYTGYTGSSVQTTTSESYDGLNNLTRTSVYDALNGATPAETTTYTYGAGGRLATMTDASGFVRTYAYDAAGNAVKISYTRTLSNGSTVTEADAYRYDGLGRQVFQSVATYNSGTATWSFGDTYQTQYDTYGEVSARGVNGMYQQTYAYNNAGQLWRTNANNGSVQMYLYDADGNQTLEIDSSGNALPIGDSWATLTLAQAIAILTNNGANAIGASDPTAQGLIATITAYDARGQATSNIEPYRELSLSGSTYTTTTITTSSVYDAFGDVIQSTDGNGNVTNYTYSTLGKMLTRQLPSVSYTQSNGTVSSAHPTTTYYYDLSGRQVGVQDADGNTTTQTLLANTGYEGNDPTTLKTFDPDGGVVSDKYDVFGNLRSSTNQISQTTTYAYDAMNRLVEQDNPTRAAYSAGNPTSSAVELINYYAYDGLGQRIQSWNNEIGSSHKATTDYDSEGRVVSTVDLDGYATTTSYTWNAAATTTGLGTFGGWVKTTTLPAGVSERETDDYFGNTVALTNYGGYASTYTFDLAGRLSTEVTATAGLTLGDTIYSSPFTLTYAYYNTGLVASISSTETGLDDVLVVPPSFYLWEPFTSSITESYQYDANGNRTAEQSNYGNATATYDALNRMTAYADTMGAAPSIVWKYDLNGNVVEQKTVYYPFSGTSLATSTTTQDYWFKYDSMNRMVTEDGEFVGSAGSGYIDRGVNGTDVLYNAAGQRVATDVTLTGRSGSNYTWQDQKELYTYSADGYLAGTNVALGSVSTTSTSTYTSPPAATGSGNLQSVSVMDAMGRVTSESEYNAAGTSVVYSKTATYDADSNTLTDSIVTVSGSNTYVQGDTFHYGAAVTSGGSTTYTGAYQGGNVTDDVTTLTKNGSAQPTTETTNSYVWADGEEASGITYTPNTAHPGTTYTTTYDYDGRGNLLEADIEDGTPRGISYYENVSGQIIESANSKGPESLYYFYNGVQLGLVTNNGTNNVTFAAGIADQTATPGTGFYLNGSSSPTPYAAFGTQFLQTTALQNYPATPVTYTVQDGDTLESIAQAMWGDSSLWYEIADANGISDDSDLTTGESLIIPTDVSTVDNNSTTNTVYNTAQAIGNTSPTHPKPPSHHGGCGGIGEILLAVIAVAVTVVTAGAALAAAGATVGGVTVSTVAAGINAVLGGSLLSTSLGVLGGLAIGAGAAALGSIVSQGVGLATGLQSKFSWSQVGLAAIGSAVGAEVSETGIFDALGDDIGSALGDSDLAGDIGGYIGDGLQAAASSAITQGIGVATGLQSKFDWAGVAAAGVGAVAMDAAGDALSAEHFDLGSPLATKLGGAVITGVAGAIANGATRTLITGTDFGDNIIRALPDTIGQTIGNALAGGIQQAQDDSEGATSTTGGVAGTPGSGTPASGVPTWTPAPGHAGIPDLTTLEEEYNARNIAYEVQDGQLYVYETPGSGGVMQAVQITDDSQTLPDLSHPVLLDTSKLAESVGYAAQDPQAAAVIQTFFDDRIPIIPTSDNNDRFDIGVVVDPTTNQVVHQGLDAVYWNPDTAITTINSQGSVTGVLSPALALVHEMDHAVGYTISPIGNWTLAHTPAGAYTTLEEKRVITGLSASDVAGLSHLDAVNQVLAFSAGNGMENVAATALGEPIRTNHEGLDKAHEFVIVNDPTMHRVGAYGPLIPYTPAPKPGP
jgi:YD repeat-containing protein